MVEAVEMGLAVTDDTPQVLVEGRRQVCRATAFARDVTKAPQLRWVYQCPTECFTPS